MAKETKTVKKVSPKEAQRKQQQDDIATLEAKSSHPVSKDWHVKKIHIVTKFVI